MNDKERERRREGIVLAAYRIRSAAGAMHRVLLEDGIASTERFFSQLGVSSNESSTLGPPISQRAIPSIEELRATAAFRTAQDRYARAIQELYSEKLLADLAKLRAGDPSGIEPALIFLEADPWCFRSGYTKQTIFRYLRKVDLDEAQRDRLRAVLITAIKAGPRIEFREACRTAFKADSNLFRRHLWWIRDGMMHGEGAGKRAGWMLEALVEQDRH